MEKNIVEKAKVKVSDYNNLMIYVEKDQRCHGVWVRPAHINSCFKCKYYTRDGYFVREKK